MARLTTEERDRLKDKDYALPEERAYPIPDLEHGEKAIQLGARAVKAGTLSPEKYRRIKAAVKYRYPEIDIQEHERRGKEKS